ncbi:F-box/kelch-repeat protein At3g23880-like [Rhododendron vialii]|uniref:F-box/kelch-repeat protein At3g23880-like n=1 Tax=Rhododendron vialii TaxID=182163 RepID=UPI00265E0FF0|nr:F-box/kelch-repeat protein At3g23880-like [Rhododendron vialii]XP_058182199.1 F-box/kelch-repeat protein At3g23880-like [Rhododendron vialii]XP_058182200.1 F-box/kelch-repeat protein At3g23880-like [Rhododendron vialii]XP_058182201.1 F-box/kelch-repeat protein At3g23880-like [Rhododendron vialii]XP_058182202.1 F-box/kelch-repeat protein At3g23880-like [Rhododendron vialii]
MAMAVDCEIKRYKKTHHEIIIKTEDSQPPRHIPREIIFDILSRLPVKSLLRFRSVCKPWLSVISNPQFVKTHLSTYSYKGDDDDDDCTHHRLVLNTHPSHNVTGLKTCSLETVCSVLESQQWESAVDLDYPFNDLDQYVVVVGSCNGLMCVAATRTGTIYLLNPSTRKSKRLPDWRGSRDLYGFGFDESNDDYKVVLISYRGGGVSAKSNVMVYTLRTDSWRQIGDLSCGVPCNVLGNFLNGSLLWLVCVDNSGPGYSYVIVSLDLEKETYGEVSQPNYGKAHFSLDLELCVLERCLGVLCTSPKSHTDVWIMKEYGKIDSWTKLFTIQDVAKPVLSHRISPPLCISKNGKLLILYRQHLSVYSPKNGTFRNLVIHNANNCEQICTYVESLVSPDVDTVV